MPTPSSLLQRLFAKDTSLWTDDKQTADQITQRLGWLDTVIVSRSAIPRLHDFARQVRAEGYDPIVLLGMGGSSLASEVYRRCFSVEADSPELIVLDSTFPDLVDSTTSRVARGNPLFIVSSKSGTTPETASLCSHFWHWAVERFGDSAANHFVAVTDHGSPLHNLAVRHQYRELFINPANIGGRYSALSLFGLVPACLLQVDLETLLERASRFLQPGQAAEDAAGLGASLADAVARGKDKLTLEFSPELSAMGMWVDQLVSESTGKDGKGIVTVLGESTGDPARYGGDRIFIGVCLRTSAAWISTWKKTVSRLEALGHPCHLIELDDNYDLGGEFARWQIATSIASSIMGVNPFNEPDVDASKKATRDILLAAGDGEHNTRQFSVSAPDYAQLLHFFDGISSPEYAVILAFLPDDDHWTPLLSRLRDRLAAISNAAFILAFGPRYLHSSGQLHKGGTADGRFLVLTTTANRDVPVPGESYGFQRFIDAQAQGDIDVLKARTRRVLHVDLGPVDKADKKIREIIKSFSGQSLKGNRQ